MAKGPKRKIKAAAPNAASPHQIEPRYLPSYKAAEYFGVSYVTIYNAIKEGRLRCIRIGRRKLVDLSSAEQVRP
jgi:excisionase family DNA binding protein